MPLVNHTLKSLSQGVSQQHEEARFDSQVNEMMNCIPDISRGVFRRNPFNTIASINDVTFNSNPNFFSFVYDRGNEQYIVQINDNNQLTVVDATNGTTKNSFTNTYLDVPVGSTYNSVYDSFSALNIGDFTFILNRNKEVALSATVDGTEGNETKGAFYWIKDISTFQAETESHGDTTSSQTASNYEGYTYTLNGTSVTGERTYTWNSGTSSFDLTVDRLSAPDIATELATQLGTGYVAEGSFIYWTGTGAPTTWTWSDSFGSSVSLGVNGEVVDSADLPAVLPDGLVDYYNTNLGSLDVYVSGGSDDNIGYWLTYEKGVGWVESKKQGMKNTLDSSTMPHVLVRGSDGNFYFGEYTSTFLATVPDADSTLGWKPRKYGDLFTSPNPAFVGQTIIDITFYQNRLTFISGDSVMFSEAYQYGNFFPTSIRALPDTDNVEITIATEGYVNLRYGLELNDRFILFSDDTQFVVNTGILTPKTSYTTIASKYNITPSAKPIVVGDSAFFVSNIGSSDHLYKYGLSKQVDNKFVAEDVTMHTPAYINNITTKLIGHSTLGYTIMFSYGTNTLFVHNGTVIGEKAVQSAIHKWELPYPIIGASILDNELYISLLDSTNNKIILGTINLSTPIDFTTISYKDVVDTEELTYDSSIEFSEWQVKQEEYGTRRGRLQIRTILYSVAKDSVYSTTIVNDDLLLVTFNSTISTGYWDDTETWNDNAPWQDNGYKFERYYLNDEQITVMGNSEKTTITFKQNDNDPYKGFNLKTVNYEGYFHQRSRRY